MPSPAMPAGFGLRPFTPADAPVLYQLLADVFEDQEPDFERWWSGLRNDAEYDPALVFVAFDVGGQVAGAAQCWTSGFVKDLAVSREARGQGLGEALMLTAFAAFRARGLTHVDLKTSIGESPEAVRLYRRLGMVEVDWGG